MKRHGIWLAAISLGVVDAVLLRAFELAVNNGTNWLWNDVFQSNIHRWVVVPLAVVLSILLTYVIHTLGEHRAIPVETDEFKHLGSTTGSIQGIGVILAIGLMSLLAGAALGPEAPLMAASAALGAWAAGKAGMDSTKSLLILSSIGALLVAFLGSMFMALVPLLILLKQKQFKFYTIGVVAVATLSAFGVLQIIDHEHPGYGSAPPLPHVAVHDFVTALVVGFVATLFGLALGLLTGTFGGYVKHYTGRLAWAVSAAAFGLALGVFYLLGGESIQFSGSEGSKLLASHSPQYGALALIGLVAAKLLATAWSKATGYRGGLVFPSIYIGVALGLLTGQLNESWAGAGAVIGGIGGTMSVVSDSPAVTAVILFAVLPVKLLPVALLAVVGAAAGSKLFKHMAATHAA